MTNPSDGRGALLPSGTGVDEAKKKAEKDAIEAKTKTDKEAMEAKKEAMEAIKGAEKEAAEAYAEAEEREEAERLESQAVAAEEAEAKEAARKAAEARRDNAAFFAAAARAAAEKAAAKKAAAERAAAERAAAERAAVEEPVAAITEASSASPTAEAARAAAARGDLAFLAFVTDPKAAVAAAAWIAWGKSGASEMEVEVEVAREHLERQNTEAATLTRQKIAQSERLKRLEEEAAAAIEELEAATPTAETSEWEMFLVNFGTWDTSRESISSSEVEMRPGMQWLTENMNRTTLMFDAAEDHNKEDGMSVDLREQHPDRHQALAPNLVYRFETVQERVTRARASLPSGLPKSVPGMYGAAKFRSAAKSLGKRPGKLPPGLPPGPPPSSAPTLSVVFPGTSIVKDVRRRR